MGGEGRGEGRGGEKECKGKKGDRKEGWWMKKDRNGMEGGEGREKRGREEGKAKGKVRGRKGERKVERK